MAIVLLIPFLALAPLHLFAPATAKAHGVTGPVQVGISFNPHRAASMGLDYQKAFTRLEALHFRVIRLSAYWDQIDQEGYDQLDWLMNEAQRTGQPVVLAVDAKKRNDAQKLELTKYYRSTLPELKSVADQIATARKQHDAVKGVPTPIMRELPDKQKRVTKIHIRGNFLDPNDFVAAFGAWFTWYGWAASELPRTGTV